ncbi:hypothetical protein Fot_21743 [Forsythia ovata]|uniref:Uncharacterized protein n=1 Tax=Forsythia ovata TaxID=205694 RepID=A0ABD1UVT2_9LAMI
MKPKYHDALNQIKFEKPTCLDIIYVCQKKSKYRVKNPNIQTLENIFFSTAQLTQSPDEIDHNDSHNVEETRAGLRDGMEFSARRCWRRALDETQIQTVDKIIANSSPVGSSQTNATNFFLQIGFPFPYQCFSCVTELQPSVFFHLLL